MESRKGVIRVLALSGMILSVGLLSGCTPIVRESGVSLPVKTETVSAMEEGAPVSVETIDSRGEPEEEIFPKPPERVVAVWQNSVETLIALGVGDRIVAGMGIPDRECLRPEYREAYDRIPYTSLENLDLETILMMEPDLIVGWASTFSAKTLRGTDFWHRRGVATYISPGSSSAVKQHVIEDEYRDILNMGKIFRREEKAEAIVGEMERIIAEAREKAEQIGRHPRGLIVEYLGKDIHVYGEKTLAGDILRRMGGELLGADLQSIGKEQIIEMDPDVIFVVVIESDYGREDDILGNLYREKAFCNLRCVKEHRIYALPLNAIYSPGVRTYDGIRIIGNGLYGEEENDFGNAGPESERGNPA